MSTAARESSAPGTNANTPTRPACRESATRVDDHLDGDLGSDATAEPLRAYRCLGRHQRRRESDRSGAGLYDASQTDDLPAEAVLASLGCGNPLAVADPQDGETVLDLGSGGGIDVLLSAKRVGHSRFAYGLDMTDQIRDPAQAKAQMAAGLMRQRAGERVHFDSAGTAPGTAVNALSAEVLLEVGVDFTDAGPA